MNTQRITASGLGDGLGIEEEYLQNKSFYMMSECESSQNCFFFFFFLWAKLGGERRVEKEIKFLKMITAED